VTAATAVPAAITILEGSEYHEEARSADMRIDETQKIVSGNR
jgi:hypothetical protein